MDCMEGWQGPIAERAFVHSPTRPHLRQAIPEVSSAARALKLMPRRTSEMRLQNVAVVPPRPDRLRTWIRVQVASLQRASDSVYLQTPAAGAV